MIYRGIYKLELSCYDTKKETYIICQIQCLSSVISSSLLFDHSTPTYLLCHLLDLAVALHKSFLQSHLTLRTSSSFPTYFPGLNIPMHFNNVASRIFMLIVELTSIH